LSQIQAARKEAEREEEKSIEDVLLGRARQAGAFVAKRAAFSLLLLMAPLVAVGLLLFLVLVTVMAVLNALGLLNPLS
jgi:hypothetical protein